MICLALSRHAAGTIGVLALVLITSTSISDAGFADWLKKDKEAQNEFRQNKPLKAGEKPAKVVPTERSGSPRVSPALQPLSGSNDPGWLVMVYAAGDNNLDPYALADVLEMQKIGSSENFKIRKEWAWRSGSPRSPVRTLMTCRTSTG